jgi:hypothetical protein
MASASCSLLMEGGNDAMHCCHSWLGMAIRVRVSDTRRVPDPMGTGMRTIFYLRVIAVPDLNRDGYFFSLAGNPTGTRYFTTVIILGCEK